MVRIVGLVLFLGSGMLSMSLQANTREILVMNEAWDFVISDAVEGSRVDWDHQQVMKVHIPHTWNDQDVLDEEPGYYRGPAWYRKSIRLRQDWQHHRVFLQFDGAGQDTRVYVNGNLVGGHTGGYNAFRFDITEELSTPSSDFELMVRVDNSYNENIPPLSADFTFFGGIYRDVSLVYAPRVHFSLDHFGGPGIYWQTPSVNADRARVKVFGYLSNHLEEPARILIRHLVLDEHGAMVDQVQFVQEIEEGKNKQLDVSWMEIKSPSLWSPQSPVNYTLVSRIVDPESEQIIDEIKNPLGFRWFEFTADQGFLLNGSKVQLKGISRHQDYPGFGNALSAEDHLKDIMMIRDMGANFLRIAHYPQDQDVISICDTTGILTSVEIPVVNRITESQEFTDNCIRMMKEMIWQNYNHPGLVLWTYMNEVLLRPPEFENEVRMKEYVSNVKTLALQLEETARTLDPYRYTMIPNHGAMTKYIDAGLTGVPMVVGWNLYQGWYGSSFSGFGGFLDKYHQLEPERPVLVSEYGAGHDPRLCTNDPKRFDFSAEYAMRYHSSYVEQMEQRHFLSGSVIWILNDFSSEGRGDAVPHINSKGICTIDRKPKESYWFYKSIWSDSPFIKIWTSYPGLIVGQADSDNPIIRVYTNLENVAVTLNGSSMGEFQVKNGMTEVFLPQCQKKNVLTVSDPESDLIDSAEFTVIYDSELFKGEKTSLHISCGDHRYFFDDEIDVLWFPDQPYSDGLWGYTGGEAYTAKTRHGKKPASDLQILNTENDPIYQTQQIDPGSYVFDVPPGKYEITLHYAELSTSSSTTLAYNLGDDQVHDMKETREFDVLINGKEVLKAFNPARKWGPQTAVDFSYLVNVQNEGLAIHFKRRKGDPCIAAIAIQKHNDLQDAQVVSSASKY
jgi:beta-galactosidase